MRVWYNNVWGSERFVKEVNGGRIRVGRRASNDVVLSSPYVAEDALILTRRGAEWELYVLENLNGCQLDNVPLESGEKRMVQGPITVKLFPFTLTFDIPVHEVTTEEAAREKLDQAMFQSFRKIHLQLLEQMTVQLSGTNPSKSQETILEMEQALEELAQEEKIVSGSQAALRDHIAGHCARSEMLAGMMEDMETSSSLLESDHSWSRLLTLVPEREDELAKTLERARAALDFSTLRAVGKKIERVERGFWKHWGRLSGNLHPDFKAYLALRFIKKHIKDIVFGYGPLEDLLRTPTISEIMVVDRDHIYIERDGVLECSGRRFVSDEITEAIIQRIVARVGRRIDRAQPLVDARLTDGSRVNAVIPPLAVSGPCLTVRKFPARKLEIVDLIDYGSLTETVSDFLRACVLTRRNVLIAGGTGSGKTTLLNCLSDFIPDKERIVTIEDTAELQLKKTHVVKLETRQANVEGAGAYTIRDLVRNALRMRPDRIVVGECRGPEALDMLQAMNTGHDGSLTTIHANSAADVILRLEVLVQMAADLPIQSIHRQIVSAIDLIVQLTRLKDGRRCVSQVTELVGLDPDSQEVLTRDIFLLEEEDESPQLRPTGSLPTFMEDLIRRKAIQLDTFYR